MFPSIVRDCGLKLLICSLSTKWSIFAAEGALPLCPHWVWCCPTQLTLVNSAKLYHLEHECCQEKGFHSIHTTHEVKIAVFLSRVCSCFPTSQFSFCCMQHKAATLIMCHRPKFAVNLLSLFLQNFCNALFLTWKVASWFYTVLFLLSCSLFFAFCTSFLFSVFITYNVTSGCS